MTINQWLKHAESKLNAADIKTARLDSLVLLEFVLSIDRAKILAEPSAPIPSLKLTKLNNLLNRRAKHEPIAYLRGFSEFYGREFIIDKNVLVPRPESEAFIELLKNMVLPTYAPSSSINMIDVGAGSGALGISAQLEAKKLLTSNVDLLEIDRNAAKIAKINVDKFATGQTVTVASLDAIDYQDYDVILANLPYGPDRSEINEAAKHEPALAIFGGQIGLELYGQMLKTINQPTKRPLYLLLECLLDQKDNLIDLCKEYDYELVADDLLVLLFCNKRSEQ